MGSIFRKRHESSILPSETIENEDYVIMIAQRQMYATTGNHALIGYYAKVFSGDF